MGLNLRDLQLPPAPVSQVGTSSPFMTCLKQRSALPSYSCSAGKTGCTLFREE